MKKTKKEIWFWIQFIFWILLFSWMAFGCTRKQITTSTDRKEVITINAREIPPVRARWAASKDTLTYFKVFHTTDTVKVSQIRYISSRDTIYETIVDCPDMVDSTTIVNNEVTKTVTKEKTFFGKIKDYIWTTLIIGTIVGVSILGVKLIWKYSGPS